MIAIRMDQPDHRTPLSKSSVLRKRGVVKLYLSLRDRRRPASPTLWGLAPSALAPAAARSPSTTSAGSRRCMRRSRGSTSGSRSWPAHRGGGTTTSRITLTTHRTHAESLRKALHTSGRFPSPACPSGSHNRYRRSDARMARRDASSASTGR
jgi:hypothetical protein